MRIEIHTSGPSIFGSLAGFQHDMGSFITNTEKVVESFKTVRNSAYELPGGESGLEEAIDHLSARIKEEEKRQEDAAIVSQKSRDFLNLVNRVDREVAEIVAVNSNEFYSVHPWLLPALPETEKSLVEKGLEYLYDVTIGKAVSIYIWTADSLKKVWDAAVSFYHEHEKVIKTILIYVGAVVAVVAIIASGGTALVPLLTAIGISEGVATVLSITVAVVAVVAKVGSSTLNIVDIWYDTDDNTVFQKWKSGLNYADMIAGGLYSLGGTFESGGGDLIPLLSKVMDPRKAATISGFVATVSMVSRSVSITLETADMVWDIDNPYFEDIKSVVGFIDNTSGTMYDIGGIYNSFKHITPEQTKAMMEFAKTSQPAPEPSTIMFDDSVPIGQDNLSSERYFSQGNHHEGFTDFWDSGGDGYTHSTVDNPTVEYVNSRDIEGVYLFDSEVKNPDAFWNKRYSKSEYVDYVSSGKMVNNPVEVAKVDDSYYYFLGDGRHRVLVAQEQGIDIPVIIKEIYTKVK